MAITPYRNNLLSNYPVTRYLTGPMVSGSIRDLLDPSNPAKALTPSTSSVDYENGVGFDDAEIRFPAGTSLSFDTAAERVSLQANRTILLDTMVPFGGWSLPDGIVDLVCMAPIGSVPDSEAQAFVLTARHTAVTSTVELFAQEWAYGAWRSEKVLETRAGFSEENLRVVLSAYYFQEESYMWGFEILIPGHPPKAFAPGNMAPLQVLQMGSVDFLAALRPGIGRPPVTGSTHPWSFFSAVQVAQPLLPRHTQDLMRFAFGGVTDKVSLPAANSVTTLAAELAGTSPVPWFEALFSEPEKILSPEREGSVIITLINPSDPSDFERVQLWDVNLGTGVALIQRGHLGNAVKTWPAGTMVRGLVQRECFQAPVNRVEPLPGAETFFTRSASERVYVMPRALNFSGDFADFKMPKTFHVTEVGVMAATSIASATIALGGSEGPTSFMAATAVAALDGGGRRQAFRDFLPGVPGDTYRVTVAGGTGFGHVYLKGFLDVWM